MNIDTRVRATIAGFATVTALLALLAIGGSGCGGGIRHDDAADRVTRTPARPRSRRARTSR